jgi:hypothetical protein
MLATTSNAEILINESKKQLLRNKKKTIKPDYYECIQISAYESFVDSTFVTWFVNYANLVYNYNISYWSIGQLQFINMLRNRYNNIRNTSYNQ